MGGKAPSIPGPSATEIALQEQQRQTLALQHEVIQKQIKQQELLAPILYKSAGIRPIYGGGGGEITGYEEIPDPLRDQARAIQGQFYDRTQNALAGKLPIDPGIIQQRKEQEQELRERLRNQLGPGYETSSPGIEALSKFNLNWDNIYEGARRGDLTTAEQLGLAQSTANLGQQGQNFGQALGLSTAPLAGASALGGVAGGYGNAAGALQSERLAQYQAALGGYQNQQRTFGQLFGGVGNLFGLGLFAPTGGSSLFGRIFSGAGAGAASGFDLGGGLLGGTASTLPFLTGSDVRIKKDIHRVGETDEGLPIYTYKYKGTDGPTHMGVMAQDVAQVKPEAVARLGDILMVDYAKI